MSTNTSLDYDTLAQWVRSDLRAAKNATEPETAARLRASAGAWLNLAKRAKAPRGFIWAQWVPEFVLIPLESGRQLITESNAWLNVHRWDGGALPFLLREMAVGGWEPGTDESPEFAEMMREALSKRKEDLETLYAKR